MKTIVVSSQKGGSAKTTLTALLSVEAELAGDGPAWVIDTDQQGSLARWHERRESETPMRAEIPFKELAGGVGDYCRKAWHGFLFYRYCPRDFRPKRRDHWAGRLGFNPCAALPR